MLMLVIAELLGGSPSQDLHGLAGHPVMLQQEAAQVVQPLPGQRQTLFEPSALAVPLRELHQLTAAAQTAEQQNLHLERCGPDIHGTIDHEGTIRNEQHRCSLKGWMEHQIQQ